MTYERFDVVRVPFPFTDRTANKNRPALVLSSATFNAASQHLVLAMITSADNPPWPLDSEIVDLASAALPARSVVRCKLFTLDGRLVRGKLGGLSAGDQEHVSTSLAKLWSQA